MALRVTFGASTAAELLVTLAAVADPDWRGVIEPAEQETAHARRTGLLRRTTPFGRFGFINLLGVLPDTREPHSIASLLDWVRRTPAPTLHLVCAGGRRRQVLELSPKSELAAALAGDQAARRKLLAGLGSGATVVEVSPWLLRTPSTDVKAALLEVLAGWRDARFPPDVERALRTSLDAEVRTRTPGGPEVIHAVAGGLSYDPPSAPHEAVLLPTPSARPIVVVVDDVRRHVIAYPPPAEVDPRDRLLSLTRALGDPARLTILELLRPGALSATELASAVGSPRTSLLHHLAMLRAAGLLTTAVGDNNATLYALRPDAVDELHAAAVIVLQRG